MTDDTEAEASDLDKQCGGYHYKILKDGTVEVIAYEGSDTTIFIPAYMENRAVTVIGPEAFKGNKKAERIYLPQGAVEIGEEAFAGHLYYRNSGADRETCYGGLSVAGRNCISGSSQQDRAHDLSGRYGIATGYDTVWGV